MALPQSKDSGGRLHHFRDRVMEARELSPADQRDLLMLSASRARPDGSLRGAREGRTSYYDEQQLAAVLNISVRTFERRWARWLAAGFVKVAGRPKMGRLERWLVSEGHDTVELEPVVSAAHATVERRPAASVRKSNTGATSRTHARRAAPRSRKLGEDPTDCLRLGFDLLKFGVATQIVKPDGSMIEVLPSNPGPLMRMLGSGNPDLAVAALISDKPPPEVLYGAAKPRTTARRQRLAPDASNWPIDKLLGALQQVGIRPMPKGIGRWSCRCPAHSRSLSGSPSATDSLLVTERADGKASVKCFKSCDWRQVLDVLGLYPRDLYPKVQGQ